MHWRKLLPAALVILLLPACQKQLPPPTNGTVTATTSLNVSYGSDAQQKMDVYLPAGRSVNTTKVMVLLHGGSWTGGDKTDLSDYVDTLKKRLPDYAIFNINYRLSANPNNVFPTQENDVKAALTYINNQAATYLISGKYALVGVSAGAHLAMLQGFKYTTPIKPKVIASFSGPSDLIEMYNNPVNGVQLISVALSTAVGATPLQDSLLYATSSPVNYITTTSPPTIIFHGGVDPLVSTTQALEVRDKLVNAGVANQYIFYPNAAHIGTWDDATMYDAFNKLQVFLQANVL